MKKKSPIEDRSTNYTREDNEIDWGYLRRNGLASRRSKKGSGGVRDPQQGKVEHAREQVKTHKPSKRRILLVAKTAPTLL